MMTPRSDGPDLSHHNLPVHWPAVPRFDLITCKLTDGRQYPQVKLDAHVAMIRQMRHLGARWVAPYHWLRASPVVEQVNFFLRVLNDQIVGLGGLRPGEMVQLDWEVTVGEPIPTGEMVEEWCDRVEQEIGRECVIVYSSDWLPDSTLDEDSRREMLEWREAHPERPYWHANYRTGALPHDGPTECAAFDATVWQWTSTAAVAGFPRGIDMNHVWQPDVLDRLCGRIHPTPVPPIKDELMPGVPMPPTLRLGDRGPNVKRLQGLLNAVLDGPDLTIDGVFGPRTGNYVTLFQAVRGITVDQIVGPQTWSELWEDA